MDPLTQLNDIQLAPAVANYPIAVGWWLLLALLLSIIWGVWRYYKRYQQKTSTKKQAISQLKQATTANEIIAILKWSAIQYGCRAQVANLHSKQLLVWLQQQLPAKHQQTFEQLADIDLNVCYQPQVPENIMTQLRKLAQFWLVHALPLSFNSQTPHLQEAK